MSPSKEPTLRFLGASGTVTGSRFLLETGTANVLLDCGLFQGGKPLRLRNWSSPPFDPSRVDAVVLSHAHLDHSGYLPVLVQRGFEGPVHCTPGTRDVVKVLLPDAAKLEEEQAARMNRLHLSKHKPALPLFTTEDAEKALTRLQPHHYAEQWLLADGLPVIFRRAGHILGSATVDIEIGPGTRLVHSGDLGRWNQPILRDPDPVEAADVLLIESTYGDRVHAPDPTEQLARIVRESAQRGGALLVPAFAVGRAQNLIWMLRELEESGRIPHLPVFIDSPMANHVSDATCMHEEDLDHEMRVAMAEDRCPLCCKTYHLVASADESKALNDRQGPMIVIAGSGMVTGGRILHHLRNRLPDPRTTVLLVGFQAKGTRGRTLQDRHATLSIFGQDVPVRARVEVIDGLSAHADQEEILRWLSGFRRPPRQTWVVHGEPGPAAALARAIRERLGWSAEPAVDGARVSLGGAT
jgi:metallo-beta-lactamase family protein